MPTVTTGRPSVEDRIFDRVSRRIGPILVSAVFIGLGLAYFFRWGSVVRHVPSLWLTPGDMWTTYKASGAAAHGHFGAVYGSGFLAFPGILVLMAPLGAAINSVSTQFVQIASHGHPTTQVQYLLTHGTPYSILNLVTSKGNLYVIHHQAFLFVAPFILVVTCSVFFALDALAERLQVGRWQRAVLCTAQGVLVWEVTVFYGHPEDAVAVALMVYALILAFDERFTGAGWLFGLAIAVQPLVIVVFPLFLVLGGRRRALGLVVRGVVPAALLTLGPLIAGFHPTVHALLTQPTFPNLAANHRTGWIFLAPSLGGHGMTAKVGGGPVRLVALALAAGLGWWALRWRTRPEMIVWAVAIALALRVYTESVLTPYYVWPALAVGVLAAARGTPRRFGLAVVLAVATIVVSQWNLGEYPWWILQMAGVTGILVAAAAPEPVEWAPDPSRARAAAVPVRRGPSTSKDKQKRKSARTARKRTARR
jgi:hypothetical protein